MSLIYNALLIHDRKYQGFEIVFFMIKVIRELRIIKVKVENYELIFVFLV